VPTIKLDLDPDSFRHLSELAVEERRPIPWQAEVLLIRAIAASVKHRTRRTAAQPQEELVETR
jgi:hypothetical protein